MTRVVCPECNNDYAARKDGTARLHGCDRMPAAPGPVLLPLRFPTPPLTKNMVRRLHFQREAQLRRDAITDARWIIRAAMLRGELKPMVAADIVLHWRQPDRRGRDGDGAQPTLSLLIDALVLEGVLPNDTWEYVVHSGVTCHPPRKGLPGSLWLEISEPVQEAS